MLTGLLKETAGKAQVFGLDMFEQQDEVRQMLGVCPQHNVLFDYLTTKEHLELYGAFRGLSTASIQEKVEKMIFTHQTQTFAVGISIGIATWDGKESAESLFARCENALSQAKKKGGGQYWVATTLQA